MRVRVATLFALGLLPVFATPTPAAEPSPPKPLVTKVFSVADLVTPVPDFGPAGEKPGRPGAWNKPTVADSADHLVRLVTEMVRPYAWQSRGGRGTAEFFEIGYALVVTNAPDVIAEVAEFLEALRRLQDVSVCTEVRILKVPAGFRERAGVKADAALTERELATLLAAVQGERDATVTQCPKVTTFDGQVATVRCGDQKSFVTGVEAHVVGGKVVFAPRTKAVDLGDTLTLCGRVSADEKFVRLRASLTRTTEVGPEGGLRVTGFMTPVFEGGSSQHGPVPQSLRLPLLNTVSVEKTVVVPSGGTVVLGGWKEPGGSKDGPPVVGGVPHLYQLFTHVRAVPECEVLVLATARVIRPERAEAAPMPRAVSAAVDAARQATRATDAPTRTQVQALVVKVPAGFLSDAGLAPEGNALVLTPRELNMLSVHLRNTPDREILARPALMLVDQQTGHVRVGYEREFVTGLEVNPLPANPDAPPVTPKKTTLFDGLRLEVTPRVGADGSVLLRAGIDLWRLGVGRVSEVGLTLDGKGPANFRVEVPHVDVGRLQTTTRVPEGHTVVVCGLRCGRPGFGGHDGPFTALVKRCVCGDGELLVFLTPHVVRAEVVKPAGHTEPAAPKPAAAPVPHGPVVQPPLVYGRHGTEPYPQR